MSAPTIWTYVTPPAVEGGKPEWGAWVDADDANWGTLHILHVPTKSIVMEEPVSLALDISAFWTGKTSEDNWAEMVDLYIANNDHEGLDRE